jgi:hypothetical protein
MRTANRIGRGLAWLAALALTAAGSAVHATSVREMTIVDLLAHSQVIVAGKVEKVSDGFAANGVPFTEVTLEVTDPIRGTKGKTHTFRQFGLEKPRTLPDGRVYLGGRPQGWPTWRQGEVALVFLYPKARLTGLQTTVGLGYGKLSLGNGRAINAYDNASLFSNVKVNRGLLTASERSLLDTSKGSVDARTLSRFLHRAVDGNWVQNGSIANAKR